MRQFSQAGSFDKVFTRPSMPLWGRWLPLRDGDEIVTPAKRHAATAPVLSLAAVAAIVRLLEGRDQVAFVSAADPSIFIVAEDDGDAETVVYRTRDQKILNSTPNSQSPTTAALFAAHLLANRSLDLASAYSEALAAHKASATDAILFPLVATAADELVAAVAEEIDQKALTWFYTAKIDDGDMEEVEDAGALDLRPLFTDPVVFGAFQRGEPTDFTVLDRLPSAVHSDGLPAGAEKALDPKGFLGKQLDTTIKFMDQGRHILHHGPTGTGKSFVWELAMKALNPEFDADTYGYFVHGSAGLEDIDFTGNYVLGADNSRRWVDGPLVRAMKDGKRFKVEELNRLPGAMLNVLLGAMDYGRISLPRYDGQIVVARPGFAVDAMANIGREYTATEEIDPSIMRRFTIKIEYDFLRPDDELLLLRSRHPALRREDGETLVRIAGSIRQAYEEGNGTVDVDLYVSPAALLNAAGLVAAGEANIPEAIELTFLSDVAWTKSKRESVRNLIELHLRERGKGHKRTKNTA